MNRRFTAPAHRHLLLGRKEPANGGATRGASALGYGTTVLRRLFPPILDLLLLTALDAITFELHFLASSLAVGGYE